MYTDNTHLRRATSAPQRYRVGPIISNASFHYALENSPYSRDPKYVQAVMRSYIEVKEARGRSKQEIAWKLEILERELPGYVNSFMAIREEKRLPASRVFRGRASLVHHPSQISIHQEPQRESLQDQYILGHGLARLPSTASSLRARPSVGASRTPSQLQQTLRASASAAPARNPEDTDEPPPPPYASEDPEPEATRDLQLRLASEAEAAGRLNLPEPTVNAGRSSSVSDHQQEGSGGGPSNTGNENLGTTSGTPTTATSTHAGTSYSPPLGPPPNTGASLQREASRRSEHHPSTPPTDPEEARMWEESQLEEAMRLSRAAERERQELEEAMRLSLADSETPQGQGGAGPSSSVFPSMPPVFEGHEVEDHSGPASRRVSSYNPSQDLEGHHRRTASDARYQERPGVEKLTSGMDHLTIPDGWGTGGGYGSGSSKGQSNLMDDDHESMVQSHPALSPQKTGAVMQSNNPFLSPGETDDEVPLPSTPNQQPRPPQQDGSSPVSRDSPGSSRTQYQPPSGPPPPDKSLPTIPGSYSPSPVTYDPPQGVPPRPSGPEVGMGRPPPLPQRNVTVDNQSGAPSSSRPGQIPRPLPIPQDTQSPSLPRRNISTQMYSASNPPQTSFPHHSPKPAQSQSPSTSFSPPQPRAQPSPQSAALQRAISTHHGGEDPLDMLLDFHTVFLVDDSTSMAGERWTQARGALMGVAETAARYDESGIDIYFLNSKRVGKELRAPPDVEDLFAGLEPRGATPTGLRLEAILRDYMTRLERSQVVSPGLEPSHLDHVKPMNLIVVTDGVFAHPILARKRGLAVNPALDRQQLLGIAPVDDPESVLITCAKRLDRGDFPLSQVGIQFLQIGNDSEAREALQELDEGLAAAHGVRDMVDTVLFTGEEVSADLIVKTLLGGINRRLDRRS